MRAIRLAWLGTRTDRPGAMVAFFRDVLGLRLEADLPGFSVLSLPDGSKVEVFDAGGDVNPHFTTGPVAELLVEDVRSAADDLRRAGVDIVFGPRFDDRGNGWVHFRAPDGHLYGLTQDPDVSRDLGDVSPRGGRSTAEGPPGMTEKETTDG